MIHSRTFSQEMPIDLGLARVSRLLSHLGNPHHNSFKAIHIAGTNGKGSTLAFLSSILTRASIKNGRFTSPHIIEYNDCITINDEVYPLKKFEEVHSLVLLKNKNLCIGCTEFEVLTATAFKIFELEKVELALIEVGLGGRLDATNVLLPPSCASGQMGGVILTAITKIGLDHESFLGDTLTKIAGEKAGIIKLMTPVVVDGTNSDEVLQVIRARADEMTSPCMVVEANPDYRTKRLFLHSPLLGRFQLQNLSVALRIIDLLKSQGGFSGIDEESLKLGIENTKWPGRLQSLIDPKSGIKFILDGAHNESAAIELGAYLEGIRERGMVLAIALSKGKSVHNLLKHITNPDDTIIPVTFKQPENMPWVESYKKEEIQLIAKEFVSEVLSLESSTPERLFEKVQQLRSEGDDRPVVICGSLYLCSDILRYVKECATR